MATQGPLFPGTAISAAIHAPEDDDAWVSPTSVGADDGVVASITAASFDAPDVSRQLYASQFGFTIPVGATIDGITVEIERRAQDTVGEAEDFRVQLTTAENTFVGTNKADTVTAWPTTLTIATYGGAADTWSASPTVAMVNDTAFGVTLSVTALLANADIEVDFIRMTITYTPPPADAVIRTPDQTIYH